MLFCFPSNSLKRRKKTRKTAERWRGICQHSFRLMDKQTQDTPTPQVQRQHWRRRIRNAVIINPRWRRRNHQRSSNFRTDPVWWHFSVGYKRPKQTLWAAAKTSTPWTSTPLSNNIGTRTSCSRSWLWSQHATPESTTFCMKDTSSMKCELHVQWWMG